jgi:hypothetical protein
MFKCMQHNRIIFFVDDLIFHTNKTPCWTRLIATPYENKEPDNVEKEGNDDRSADRLPGVHRSSDQG